MSRQRAWGREDEEGLAAGQRSTSEDNLYLAVLRASEGKKGSGGRGGCSRSDGTASGTGSLDAAPPGKSLRWGGVPWLGCGETPRWGGVPWLGYGTDPVLGRCPVVGLCDRPRPEEVPLG